MRLRLVKVVCQPHFVLEDDDGNLSEQIAQPITVDAKSWPTFATDEFPKAVERLEAQLVEGGPE
jgi:hypothetical protein